MIQLFAGLMPDVLVDRVSYFCGRGVERYSIRTGEYLIAAEDSCGRCLICLYWGERRTVAWTLRSDDSAGIERAIRVAVEIACKVIEVEP